MKEGINIWVQANIEGLEPILQLLKIRPLLQDDIYKIKKLKIIKYLKYSFFENLFKFRYFLKFLNF